jgi:diguanylate cyclase (GGDEF)-like protein/PAS domain S-box-containing protein
MRRTAHNPLYLILLFLFIPISPQLFATDSLRTVRVGVYNNPPLLSLGPNGEPRGFFITILARIAQQEHWQLRYLHGNWSVQLSRLKSGRIDLLPAIAIDSERSKQFLFNQETVIANWAQIFVPEHSPIHSIPDLDGRRIAVLENDIYLTGKSGIGSICRSFAIECRLTPYPTYDLVLRAVARNKVDAGLVNRLFGAVEGPSYSAVPSPIVLMPTDVRFAISRINPNRQELIDTIDHHLRLMKSDDFSIYHTSLRSLFEPSAVKEQPPAWAYKVIFVSLLTVAGLFILVQVLKWRITHQRQELERNEARYRDLFEGVAIALCESEGSRILANLSQLVQSGIRDIDGYFSDHPEKLKSWVSLIGIVTANPAACQLFGVTSVDELQQWLPRAFTPSTYRLFQQTLVASSRHQRIITGEMDLLTFDRRLIQVIISFPLPQTLEESHRVPISMLDVTPHRQTEKRLSQVIQGAALGFWDWNLVTDEYQVNDRWIEMLGLERSKLNNLITDLSLRIHPDDVQLTLPLIREHIEQKTPFSLEFRMCHADDHWVWIQGSGSVVEYDPLTHQPTRASGTHQDISKRKHAEEALHTLMRSMVGITGEDFFQRVARELCYWFEADGANIGELVDGDRIVAYATIIDGKPVENFRYLIKGTPCGQVVKQGACLYPQGVQDLFPSDEDLIVLNIEGYAGVPIRDLSGGAIGIVWVISRKPLRLESDWKDVMEIIAARISAEIERKRATEQLEHRATFDSLTDLPNRRLLIDRLTQAQARCRRHGHMGAVLFMDLDHFKTVNDSLGHTIGDLLLIEAGRRLHEQIRDEDTASRLGGDEFVVLFSELSGNRQVATKQARQGAKKIQLALSEPYDIRGNALHITPSIGIVIFPMDDESADDILKYADTAMYRAKDEGRNRVRFFLPGMQQSAEAEVRLQNELRNALENRELKLYFQPKVDVEGGIIGAEALIRWFHPSEGTIEPEKFLSVAEESGQILDICNWVLKEALTLSKPWMAQYPQLKGISVNINSAHFHQAGFTQRVERTLRETGSDPHQLTLEIHEDTLASNIEDALGKIDDLRKLGVRFSIDNFGSDLASIALLRRFTLDEFKIDRQFISYMISDPKDAKLVQTLLTMARQMEIDVIAVGVENDRQFRFLRDHGCRLLQGYYFGRPQPADQFADTLERNA